MTKKLSQSDIESARVMLRDGDEDLSTILDTLTSTSYALTSKTKNEVVQAAPSSVKITGEVREALVLLPQVFGKTLVEDRRTMTNTEVSDAYTEFKTLRTIAATLKQREEVLKENVRIHMDVAAEQDGDATDRTPVDASGHYILPAPGDPVRLPVDGSNEEFSLEYRSGRKGTVSVSSEALLEAYESGQITRDQYLSLTREVRVFDEEKASQAILKDTSLLQVVREATRRSGATEPGTSLTLRKKK